MSATNQLGAGDVKIILNGKEFVLRPTLNAAQIISRQNNGIRGAIDKIVQMDMDTIVKVVSLGLGQKVVKEISNARNDSGGLEASIWEAGLTDDTGEIIGKCVEYLHVLANGGRPVTKQEASDDENPQ